MEFLPIISYHSYHDLHRHFAADRDARFLNAYDNVSSEHGDDSHLASRNEAEIAQMLLYLGAAADSLDDISFADGRKS